MNEKHIRLLCCALFLVFVMAGCSNNRQETNDTAKAPAVHAPVQTEETVSPMEEAVPPIQSEPGEAVSASEERPSQTAQPSAAGSGQLTENQQQGGDPVRQENTGPVYPAPTPAPTETVPDETAPVPVVEDILEEEETEEMKMNVQIGNGNFTATLESNAAVDALKELLESGPLVIQMSDYAGFEKVGPLGTSLPTSNSQTTTQAGDIVLYQGNQIVLFYGTNSWSYTRLGHIDDLTGWAEALGNGDVAVTFSLGG